MFTISMMKKTLTYLGFFILGLVSVVFAEKPVVLFSDMTDAPTTGWEQSSTKGAAVSIWCRNVGTSRGTSYVTVGGVNLTNDSDYAEWGATTKPTVPLAMQRITFFLKSNMATTGTYPNTTIKVTTSEGTSSTIPFHCRALGENRIYFLNNVNGDDAKSGLTVALAKKTTGWARGNLKAGDVCYLIGSGTPYTDHDKGGSTYHNGGLFTFGYGTVDSANTRNHWNGIEGKSITVTAYPGDDVQMKANEENSAGLRSCIYMFYSGRQLEYWTFSKFTMEAAWAAISLGGSGYTTAGTSNIRIIGNDATTIATTTGQWGNIIVAYGCKNGMEKLSIYGNYLHDQCANYRGEDTGRRVYQIYIGGYGQLNHIDVGWNDMGWGSQGRGLQVYGHVTTDTLEDFYVHDNWFHDNSRQNVILGGGDGSSNYGFIKTCYFYNNIVSNPGDGDVAILIGGTGNGRYGGSFSVYNNVFYKAGSAYPTVHISGKIESAILKNNIIVGHPNSWGYYTYYPDTASPNLTGENNLYYGAGADVMPSWDSSVLSNNTPAFVTNTPVSFLDFKIMQDSPLIDAGADTTPVVKSDFLGVARLSNAVDIGAFEYGDTGAIIVPVPPPPTNLRIE